MRCFEPVLMPDVGDAQTPGGIVTTLYDLIAALNMQVTSSEDDLVIAAMKNIMNTRRLMFVEWPHAHKLQCV